MVLEKKKVYSNPITGFATVNKMHSNGLKRLTRIATTNTAISMTGAEVAITSGRKVFKAQFAARFRKIAKTTAIMRNNSHPKNDCPLGSTKFSR